MPVVFDAWRFNSAQSTVSARPCLLYTGSSNAYRKNKQ